MTSLVSPFLFRGFLSEDITLDAELQGCIFQEGKRIPSLLDNRVTWFCPQNGNRRLLFVIDWKILNF